MTRYAIFGQPISYSLSPQIHTAFARQFGHSIDYRRIEAGEADFLTALADFATHGGVGANITVPLKQIAFALCNSTTERARNAGAVNTLTRDGEGWHGDNTDGQGLVRDLTQRQGLDLRGRRTLLLGAGGAARGVAPSLIDAGIGDLFIVNRTAERVDAMADQLAQPGRVHPRYLTDLPRLGEFDLIVNATSAGRNGEVPKLPSSLVAPRTAAVDLSYGGAEVPFLSWARASGCRNAIDGIGMLVEQAALAYTIWHGDEPDTDEVYDGLRTAEKRLVTAD